MSKKSSKRETFAAGTGSYPGLLADIKQRICQSILQKAFSGSRK